VSLACATLLAEGRSDRAARGLGWKDVVLPGFLRGNSVAGPTNEVPWYHNLVDMDDSLTTNSSFVELFPPLGVAAFPFALAVSFAFAIGTAWLPRHGFLPTLSAGAILYAFAESWRTFLFRE